jgi:hypothetical protein
VLQEKMQQTDFDLHNFGHRVQDFPRDERKPPP